MVYCFLCCLFKGECTLSMQDAVVSQPCAPPAALCAVPAMHQERKEQTAFVD